jgi:hypothetical protein
MVGNVRYRRYYKADFYNRSLEKRRNQVGSSHLFSVRRHKTQEKGVRTPKRLLRTFTSTEPFLSPDDIVMIGIGPVPTLNYQGGPIELLKVRPI